MLSKEFQRNEINKIAEPTFNIVWHDEMSQEHTLFGQSPFIEAEVSNLSVHFLDDPSSDFRVVPGLAQPAARLLGPELEVRHVDVDEALHQPERGEGVVGARVVHDRDAQTPLHRDGDRLDHLSEEGFGIVIACNVPMNPARFY